MSCHFMCILKKAALMSCLVAWHIAHLKTLYSVKEIYVKSAAIDMVHITCGNDVARKLNIVLLSNDVIHRCITSMSASVKNSGFL